jgi:TolB-like protein
VFRIVGSALAFLVICAPLPIRAQEPAPKLKLAVLELRNEAQLTAAEAAYLTDRVRDAASRVLPGERFLVMTRESIVALLPPGRNLADCTAADCEIEMGRALGVDYLISGEVLRFAGKLRLNLKAHHCLSGAFLGSEAAGGATLEELESATRQTAPALLALVRRHAGGGATGDTGPGVTGPPGAYGEAPAQPWSPAARRTTVVSFNSDPPGAVVLADDQLLCQATPCSRNLPAGTLTVSMQKERYVSRKETVAIPADGSLPRIAWKLTPDFGWLTVTSDPDSVIVTINGEPAGRTPLARRELSPGAYDVKCADGRFFEKGERFTLGRGEDRAVRLTPAPREGAIVISAADAEGNAVTGTLSVDGRDVGPVPGTYKLLVGRHAVSVIAADDRWTGTVDIAEGQIAEMKAKVARQAGRPGFPAGTPGALRRFDPSGAAFVWIPAGGFEMGRVYRDELVCGADERPDHLVTLTKGFWLQTTEVTVELPRFRGHLTC